MRAANPTPQPPTWRTRVSLIVWSFLFGLSGLGDPAGSQATAGMARRGIKTLKPPTTTRWRHQPRQTKETMERTSQHSSIALNSGRTGVGLKEEGDEDEEEKEEKIIFMHFLDLSITGLINPCLIVLIFHYENGNGLFITLT